jgi:hypothetical protein
MSFPQWPELVRDMQHVIAMDHCSLITRQCLALTCRNARDRWYCDVIVDYTSILTHAIVEEDDVHFFERLQKRAFPLDGYMLGLRLGELDKCAWLQLLESSTNESLYLGAVRGYSTLPWVRQPFFFWDCTEGLYNFFLAAARRATDQTFFAFLVHLMAEKEVSGPFQQRLAKDALVGQANPLLLDWMVHHPSRYMGLSGAHWNEVIGAWFHCSDSPVLPTSLWNAVGEIWVTCPYPSIGWYATTLAGAESAAAVRARLALACLYHIESREDASHDAKVLWQLAAPAAHVLAWFDELWRLGVQFSEPNELSAHVRAYIALLPVETIPGLREQKDLGLLVQSALTERVIK